MKRIAMLLALVSPGCSFMMSRPPAGAGAARCTTSRVPALLDTYEAVGSVVVTALTTSLLHGERERAELGPLFLATGLGTAAVYGASAAYGFHQVSACRRYNEALAARGPQPDIDIDVDVTVRPR